MIKYEKLSNGGVVAQTPTGMVEISPNDDGAYEVYRDGRFLGVAKTLVAAKKILSSAPRKNPLPTRAKLAKALALRAAFRDTAGTRKDKKPRVKTVTVRGVDGVQIGIGKVAAIEYTLVDEKGKPIRGQSFRHEFTGRSQPMLTASHDGKQLYFVGGQYRFKTDGINDI